MCCELEEWGKVSVGIMETGSWTNFKTGLVDILEGLHDVIACFGDSGGSLRSCVPLSFSQHSPSLDASPWRKRGLKESSWDKMSAHRWIARVVPAAPLHVLKDGDRACCVSVERFSLVPVTRHLPQVCQELGRKLPFHVLHMAAV